MAGWRVTVFGMSLQKSASNIVMKTGVKTTLAQEKSDTPSNK
jgi:hypothetical protein